jgi:uncharacterized membrane protein YkvA (DUF1232 family)
MPSFEPWIGVIAGLFGVWALTIAALFVLRPRHVRAIELVRLVPDVVRLVRDLLADPLVPRGVRFALAGLLLWLLNPIDLIPEFIPVLGPLDDVVVAVLILRHVRQRLGDEGLRRRWRGTEDGFELLLAVLAFSR